MMYAPSCYPIIFSRVSVADSYKILQHKQNEFYSENYNTFQKKQKVPNCDFSHMTFY